MAFEAITTSLSAQYLLDAGDALFVAATGSVQTGTVQALTMRSAALLDISITVQGRVASGSQSAIELDAGSATTNGSYSVLVQSGGSVTSAFYYGIELTGSFSTVSNAGSITGAYGLVLTGNSAWVANAGTITAQGDGIFLSGNQAIVTNSGSITGNGTGLNLFGTQANIGNTGLISATAQRGVLLQQTALSTVANDGTIQSTGSDGIWVLALDGATNYITNSGRVSAGNNAIMAGGTATSLLQLQNSGQLEGVFNGVLTSQGGLVLNNLSTGVISGQRTAGVSAAGNLSLVNDGTILATATAAKAITMGAGALENTIQNHGEITALLGRAIDGGETTASSSTVLRNFGTITGAILGGAGQEFMFNRGTIQSVNTQGGADILRNHGLIDGGVALGDGADIYRGRFGELVGPLDGGTGNDLLLGGDFDDDLAGGGGVDTVDGGGGNDILRGNAGFDTILGGAGDDLIQGGTDRDDMTGGTGADIFVFTSSAEIGFGNLSDRIQDFAGIDAIDVSSFMASANFLGAGAFTAGGDPEIRYTAATGIIEGDENGDGLVDWSIWLVNKFPIKAADFLT